MRWATALALAAALSVVTGCSHAVQAQMAEVDGGAIRGELTADGEVAVWRGVPFAAPPVGGLRWRPPQPVVPWDGVRDCTQFGPACPQPPSTNPVGRQVGAQDEDCLFLNVWAPAAPEEPLPVMVWIHGGGCTTGAGSMGIYDGELLARRGVVLVTINYRLGPLGYLAHPLLSAESERGVSGNYGMLDQIAALQWVERNITKFGGDPDRVTIFGESAGGLSVARLLISPLSDGLFDRAILQSAAARGCNRHLREDLPGRPSMESVGERLFADLGIAGARDPLAAARELDPQTLIDAAEPQVGLMTAGTKYGPIIDGWAVPDDPETMLADGRFHHVPVIAGANADDGSIFAAVGRKMGSVGYTAMVRRLMGEEADEVLRLFPAATPDETVAALSELLTVSAFVAPARALVRSVAEDGGDAWLYHFTRTPSLGPATRYGAFHGLEIAYIFGVRGGFARLGETDRALSEAMAAAWVQFATAGDPNGPAIPNWPQWTATGEECMYFGDEIEAGRAPLLEACELFDRINAH